MAGTSLLALIDDITSVLDDVAVLTKLATKKTAGVLGDDLALNAHQLSGARPDRELPVVWAVAKGSMVNKAILVPAALAISALAPWAVTPLLMVGGAFLCFEGVEKLAHRFLHPGEADAEHAAVRAALTTPEVDLRAVERDKIKGAVRTDFVLSAEIVAIALGTVAGETFAMRAAVLVGIALLMTVGVYGLVAGIVKLDDLGQHLAVRGAQAGDSAGGRLQRRTGAIILAGAPYLMRALSIAGTAAMFLVGGGILSHGIPAVGAWLHGLAEHAAAVPGVGKLLAWLVPLLGDAAIGVTAGALVLALVSGVKRAVGAKKSAA